MYEERINELGINIPKAPEPLAVYIPAVREGNMVYTAGQIPLSGGELKFSGKVGQDLDVEAAQKAAELCAINCLSVVKSVAGNLDNIERILKLTVFVNSAPGFTEQHKVANGASELIGKIFGDTGKHARSAVGVNELPINSAVEVEMIVKLKS